MLADPYWDGYITVQEQLPHTIALDSLVNSSSYLFSTKTILGNMCLLNYQGNATI